jgi:hypothetical protein
MGRERRESRESRGKGKMRISGSKREIISRICNKKNRSNEKERYFIHFIFILNLAGPIVHN